MSDAAQEQNGRRGCEKSGHYKRVRVVKQHGYKAIDGRTYAGREAKRWRALAIEKKGGESCAFHIRLEIDASMFDLQEASRQRRKYAQEQEEKARKIVAMNQSRGA